jgi:hypothetical protein
MSTRTTITGTSTLSTSRSSSSSEEEVSPAGLYFLWFYMVYMSESDINDLSGILFGGI